MHLYDIGVSPCDTSGHQEACEGQRMHEGCMIISTVSRSHLQCFASFCRGGGLVGEFGGQG